MTLVLLVAAAALILLGGAASAYAAVDRIQAAAAVACGAVLVAVAGLDAGTWQTALSGSSVSHTGVSLALAGGPTLLVLATVMVTRAGAESAVALAGGLLAVSGPLLFLDPFRDPACVGHCPSNSAAILSLPLLAGALHHAGFAVLMGVSALVALRARPRTLASGALPLATAPAWTGLPLGWTAATVAAVGLAATAPPVVRATTRRGRLATVVERLSATEDPQVLLRRLVPDLVIGYRADAICAWVDSSGCALEEQVATGRRFVDVWGPEGAIARVWNPGSPSEVAAWSRSLRGPARLALDNARLDAVRRAEANQVVASSRRLVARADEERRQLERDLHDGAQQHVLALGLLLSLHEQSLDAQDPARASVARCRTDVTGVLDDLRDLAHGIHAASIDEPGGLERSLQLLAGRSRVPLEVGTTPRSAMDVATRMTTYALVEEALTDATGPVVVQVHRRDSGWAVTLRLLGPAGTDLRAGWEGAVPPRARDRFRALGGSLMAEPAEPGDKDGAWMLRGWLPASPPHHEVSP